MVPPDYALVAVTISSSRGSKPDIPLRLPRCMVMRDHQVAQTAEA